MRVLTGMAIGLEQLPGLDFRANTSYVCCRLCGKVFQSDLDRRRLVEPNNLKIAVDAYNLRRSWANRHAQLHPVEAHDQLRASGLFCTPEAANKLAAFGIIDLEEIVSNGIFVEAYTEASPIPQEDAEGGKA